MKKELSAFSRHLLIPFLAAGALGAAAAGCGDGSDPITTEERPSSLYLVGDKWTNKTVRVCWDNGDIDQGTGKAIDAVKAGGRDAAELRAEVRRVLKTSWHSVTALSFYGFQPCTDDFVHTIAVHWDSVASMGRSATLGLGDPGDSGRRVLYLNPYSSDLSYRVMHEFGHALGFAHEQNRPDNFVNGNPVFCSLEASSTSGGTYLTPFDVDSIMDYCGPNARLSPLDIQGASQLYGHRALPIEDMNSDGFEDVTRVTASGTTWGLSSGGGGYTYFDTPRPDLSAGTVTYTRGDFNGDRKIDLIVTTATGSYWYFAGATGWSQQYVRNDLTRGSVMYTPGDVNGN